MEAAALTLAPRPMRHWTLSMAPLAAAACSALAAAVPPLELRAGLDQQAHELRLEAKRALAGSRDAQWSPHGRHSVLRGDGIQLLAGGTWHRAGGGVWEGDDRCEACGLAGVRMRWQ